MCGYRTDTVHIIDQKCQGYIDTITLQYNTCMWSCYNNNNKLKRKYVCVGSFDQKCLCYRDAITTQYMHTRT